MITNTRIKQFQNEILSWYEKNIRDLPWRQTREPYSILVSEVMSQQTQLSRVIPKYLAWMEELPTVESLATSDKATVLRLWSGLGYNRRALFLQKAAQVIVSEYNGVWPEDPTELEKLPGIGKYTAAAVACFAFDKQIPVVDTNVRKVILTKFPDAITRHSGKGGTTASRISMGEMQRDPGHGQDDENETDSGQARMTEELIYEIALQLLPVGKAYEWNQALMDYAGLMLRKEKIPVPKQSKFLGSKRFYRGKVLKLLVKQQGLSFDELWEAVRDDKAGDQEWLKAILQGLMSEGFIHEQNNHYFL